MNEQLKVIRDLMEDIHAGASANFSAKDVSELEDKLRKVSFEIFGKENPTMLEIKRSPYAGQYFALVEGFIATYTREGLESALQFAEIRNIAWGDSPVWEIENSDLFDVVAVAKGNGNVRRQRIENGNMTLAVDAVAIKIFENYKRFLSGRTNWSGMIQRVGDSYIKEIKERVFTAFYGFAPVSGNATFNVNDAGGFAIQSVIDMVDHVQAENTGVEIVIAGTRQALRKLAPVISTDEANRDMYVNGVYTTAEGYKLMVIDQMHVKNGYTFKLSNKQLMVMPMTSEKFVKILEEGNPIIAERTNTWGDMSQEYMFYNEVGVGVITGTKMGKYTWS
jgi:hypothetical protein